MAAGLALLCALVAGAALWQAAGDAITTDEAIYVTDGLAGLTRHDLRLNPQHPPLGKALAALPALLAHPPLPDGIQWRKARDRRFGNAFIERLLGAHMLREVTLLSRLVPVLELLLTGLAVFVVARRLAGRVGGLFAASMWLLDPFVIGLGHVDGIDLPGTVSALAFGLALVRWLERRTPQRLAVLGLACGFALVVRDTGPLLLGVGVLTVAAAARDVRPVVVVGALAALVVWATYGVLDPGYSFHHLNVLPQRYIDGFDVLADVHQRPAPAFLFGHRYYGAAWWYYPGSMLVKLPATLLVSYLLAPVFLRRAAEPHRRRLLVALGPAAILLLAFTLGTKIDLGLRYLLPVLALAVVGVAPLARSRPRLAILLVAGSAAFTVSSLPHSTAWVAPPFGPGYKVATADNLDWGQDAYRLRSWAIAHHAWIGCYSQWIRCGRSAPGTHLLTRTTLRSAVHGWLGISATHLYLHQWDPWLKRIRPAGTLDGTQLLYHLP